MRIASRRASFRDDLLAVLHIPTTCPAEPAARHAVGADSLELFYGLGRCPRSARGARHVLVLRAAPPRASAMSFVRTTRSSLCCLCTTLSLDASRADHRVDHEEVFWRRDRALMAYSSSMKGPSSIARRPPVVDDDVCVLVAREAGACVQCRSFSRPDFNTFTLTLAENLQLLDGAGRCMSLHRAAASSRPSGDAPSFGAVSSFRSPGPTIMMPLIPPWGAITIADLPRD